MGEEIKTFTSGEVKELIGHLNTGSTYNGAYITLLTGNSIKITFENNDTLQLTSYGFEDHVILSGEINKEFMSYCIVSPEVGKILLSQNK